MQATEARAQADLHIHHIINQVRNSLQLDVVKQSTTRRTKAYLGGGLRGDGGRAAVADADRARDRVPLARASATSRRTVSATETQHASTSADEGEPEGEEGGSDSRRRCRRRR
jgi:hypothetical protein